MNSEKQSEVGVMARETLNVAVRPIAQKRPHSHECGLVVYPVDGGITRFVMRVQRRRNSATTQVEVFADTPTGQLKKTEADI